MPDLIRCRNWEDEPEICGQTCSVLVEDATSSTWVRAVLDASPEWFIVLRDCPEHDGHADPFCSLVCFTRYHTRHGHDA